MMARDSSEPLSSLPGDLDDPIEPAYYYSNAEDGAPVFTPTMREFEDFDAYVQRIDRRFGTRFGIVKVVPPAEWVAALPDIRKELHRVRIRRAIRQSFDEKAGSNHGAYRQLNIEVHKAYSVPEFARLSMSGAMRPPYLRELHSTHEDSIEEDLEPNADSASGKMKLKKRRVSSAPTRLTRGSQRALEIQQWVDPASKTDGPESCFLTSIDDAKKPQETEDDPPQQEQAEQSAPPSPMLPPNPTSPLLVSTPSTPAISTSTLETVADAEAAATSISPDKSAAPTSPHSPSESKQELPLPTPPQHQLQRKRKKPPPKPPAHASISLDEETQNGPFFDDLLSLRFSPPYYRQLEDEYWRSIAQRSATDSQHGAPMYGADQLGTLWPSADQPSCWNTNHLDTILATHMREKVPGVNMPYLYLGTWRATFGWHAEDVDLYSINYLHFGAPKQWYSIPSSQAHKFDTLVRSLYPADMKRCPEVIRHKIFHFTPHFLEQHGLTVHRMVQEKHEFVITFPRGYHAGYNLGFNCAESVNFALPRWFEFGKTAKKCRCVSDAVMVNAALLERRYLGLPDFEDDTFMVAGSGVGSRGMGLAIPSPTAAATEEQYALSPNRKPARSKKSSSQAHSHGKKVHQAPKPTNSRQYDCVLCPVHDPTMPLYPIQGTGAKKGLRAHEYCAKATRRGTLGLNGLIHLAPVSPPVGICAQCHLDYGAPAPCAMPGCVAFIHPACMRAHLPSMVTSSGMNLCPSHISSPPLVMHPAQQRALAMAAQFKAQPPQLHQHFVPTRYISILPAPPSVVVPIPHYFKGNSSSAPPDLKSRSSPIASTEAVVVPAPRRTNCSTSNGSSLRGMYIPPTPVPSAGSSTGPPLRAPASATLQLPLVVPAAAVKFSVRTTSSSPMTLGAKEPQRGNSSLQQQDQMASAS